MSTNQTVPLLVNGVTIGTAEILVENGELIAITRIEGLTSLDVGVFPMSDYDVRYIDDLASAKRATIVWTPWMGDWFTSWSPRNDNNNAEGTWDHWVQIALSILQHPATEIVRPEAYEAVKAVVNTRFYSESNRELTDEELERLFGGRNA